MLAVPVVSAQEKATVKPGDRCPEFRAEGLDMHDVEGDPARAKTRAYKVEDFKGRYVYIDVWATWCEPCLAELPHLKELEKQFCPDDVAFVSISSEVNRGKWMAMIREKEMSGVQLSTGGDRSFQQAFDIEGIPYFILLDRDGNILEMNTTRPSDPATAQKLKELLGK